MNKCHRVCEADSITGNAHSLLLAFDGQPAVVYIKADSTEEIRWLVLSYSEFHFLSGSVKSLQTELAKEQIQDKLT